jgi:site-specific recombinase XerD
MRRLVSPARAEVLLQRIDPGRVHGDLAVGLRDGALLALIAAGLTPAEIAELRADQVRMEQGELVVVLQKAIRWSGHLPMPLGARLLAWLTDRRAWGERVPVIVDASGEPLSDGSLRKTILRYQDEESERG